MSNIKESQVQTLLQELTAELMNREPQLSLRTLTMLGGERQGLTRSQVRFFTAVLENHIFDHSQTVIFTIEVDEDAYLLRFCCPIQPKVHKRLAALNYTPPLRSRWHLSVGLGAAIYAYSAIKLTPHSSVMDLFDALHVLGRELEGFLGLAGEDKC